MHRVGTWGSTGRTQRVTCRHPCAYIVGYPLSMKLTTLRLALLATLTGVAGCDSQPTARTPGIAPCIAPTLFAPGVIQCADGSFDRVWSDAVPEAPNNECESDADCLRTEACVPAGTTDANRAMCIPANCSSNEDCGVGGVCGIAQFPDDCGEEYRTACRTPQDTCRSDSDCGDYSYCWPDGDTWSCRLDDCDVGRPLLIDHQARTAPTVPRDDWSTHEAGLEPDEALAAHWTRVAALEHASVASFSRFALQMMAQGAPPTLLTDIQRAASDEIEHARLAFGLASAYAGRRIGPGPLELSGLTIETDWRSVVAALIEEACIGETLGVAEARAEADSATHPRIRAVMERIAADELRHAQLAWRSLQWLLSEAPAADRDWALDLLDAQLDTLAHSANHPRPHVHQACLDEVLRPVASALRAA